jgi:molecular chaperone GrpE
LDWRSNVQIPVRVRRPQNEEEPQETAQPEANAVEEMPSGQQSRPRADEVDWRDTAMRLQAEMDNFRKRQQRISQDQIASDRERLLLGVLPVADNLERALSQSSRDDGLREGVIITHRALVQWLKQQGVERLDVVGKPFDPAWHHAVSTVPHAQYGVEPDTVVAVSESGYRLNDRQLRPAKVVVAV